MSLSPATRLGTYEILSLIGAGGMGEVYRAHDTKLGRDVALKILPDTFAREPDRLARFRREARVLASLNHPNIAAIYGVEESGGVYALVLELVAGDTLAERIEARGPRLKTEETLAIAKQMADALDAAHEKGIVHRDLKPANVKVTPDGRIKVLDFGLAKIWVDEDTAEMADAPTRSVESRAGMILGTASYMSPEQARGQSVDKRADIWAFGCVVFELLTGQRAFPGQTTSDALVAVLEREPNWGALPAATPTTVTRLLHRCLEKDVRRRLRDIGDARAEVEETLAEGTHLRRRQADDGTPASRHRRVFGVASVLTSLVVAGALGWLWATARPTAPAPGALTSQITSALITNYGGAETAGALSPDGRTFAFVSDHGGTVDIWLRQVSGGEPVRLTNDAAVEEELAFASDGEWIYFTSRDNGVQTIWRTGVLGGQPQKVVAGAHAAAPSPDGQHLAYMALAAGEEDLTVSVLDGGSRRVLAQHIPGFPAPRPAWSHDGRSLSFVRGGLFAPQNLFVLDVATGRERQLTTFTRPNEGVGQHAWLPGDRYLAVAHTPYARAQGTADLAILDARDGSVSRVTVTVSESFSAPSVSRDGSRLVATSTSSLREVWKIPLNGNDPNLTGRANVRLVDASQEAMWTFVSRDARTLLFNGTASGGRNLWTMPLDGGGKPRQVTAVPGDVITHSALSPDGSRVVFVSFAGGTSDIWVQNIDGSDLRQLTNDAAADSWPVWSPDGQRIVFTSAQGSRQETRVMSADGSDNEKLFDGFFRGDWIRNPSGDGTLIVTSLGGQKSGVRLLDPERRQVIWETPIAGMGFSLPMFSPDGRRISATFQEARDRAGVEVLDTATGKGQTVARVPFNIIFRASWVDGGRALIVNRFENTSHIVLFDHFWEHNR